MNCSRVNHGGDIDDDLNQFCADMESELNELSSALDGNEYASPRDTGQKESERVRDSAKAETTVAASPWGMSLFSSFASSATKSLSASFSPLAKDMSSISSLATTATRAFSDTLSGVAASGQFTPEQKQQQGGHNALSQSPEALEKLRQIQSQHDAQRSEITYACILASNSAREVVVPARSVTEVPVTVPAGQEIAWKLQVKHYDILFGVKLRVQQEGSGEWTEHELVPLGRITSEEYIDESCCSERCARKFIFSLDNNIAVLYSKVVALDVVLTDDRDWKRQQQQQQKIQSSPQQTDHGSHDRSESVNEDANVSDKGECSIGNSVGSEEKGRDGASVEEDSGILAEEWTVYHNDEGQAYFYNNKTEECQWERPAGFQAGWVDVEDGAPGGEESGWVEEEEEESEHGMEALMLKLSQGFKAGLITSEQRQQFMTAIIECRDLSEVHRELSECLAAGRSAE